MRDPITLTNFLTILDDPSVTEADLMKFLPEDESVTAARSMGPGFLFHEKINRNEKGLESSGLLNAANFVAKKLHRPEYQKQLEANPGAYGWSPRGTAGFNTPSSYMTS